MLNVPAGMLSGFAPAELAFNRGGEMFVRLPLRGAVGTSSHEVTATRTRMEAAAKNAGGTHGRRVFRLGWYTTVVMWAGTSGGEPCRVVATGRNAHRQYVTVPPLSRRQLADSLGAVACNAHPAFVREP